MIGAIIGDMVGSIYEFANIKSKEFNIFNSMNRMTDDSYLTIAVAKALINNYPIKYDEESINRIKKDLIFEFKEMVKRYPDAGFGGSFYRWSLGKFGKGYPPYSSFGNGSAMRTSSVGWIANSIEEVKKLSKIVSEVTHNHVEGIKGAEATSVCIYLARIGKSKEYIKQYVIDNYYPRINDLDFDTLVKEYTFDVTCQGSVPESIYAFLISDDLEDTIRNCMAIGGDCDTTAAIAGAIAEAYYSPKYLSEFESKFISTCFNTEVTQMIRRFHQAINSGKIL